MITDFIWFYCFNTIAFLWTWNLQLTWYFRVRIAFWVNRTPIVTTDPDPDAKRMVCHLPSTKNGFLDLWCYSPRGSPKCDIIYYDLLLGIIFSDIWWGYLWWRGPCSHKRKPQMIAYIYHTYGSVMGYMYISLESIQLINGTFFSPTRNFFNTSSIKNLGKNRIQITVHFHFCVPLGMIS